MRKLIFLFIGVCILAFSNTTHAQNNFTGEWKFDIPEVSYNYQKGKIVFEQPKDSLTGKVIFERTGNVDFSEIKTKDGKITLTLWIQGEKIKVKGNVDKNKLRARTRTPEGKVEFVAEKITGED